MATLDLEEACKLGRVEHIDLDFRLPKGVECLGFRLPDYRYAGSGDLMLIALHDEGHVLFVDCGPMDMTDHLWFEEQIERYAEDAGNVALYLTHFHFDHMGDASWFSRQGIACYASEQSRDLTHIDPDGFECVVGAKRPTPIENVAGYLTFQANLPTLAPDAKLVADGTRLNCGRWHLDTISLPGHLTGHAGLVSEGRRVLFSGDCIGRRPPVFALGLDGHDGAAAVECWRHLKTLPLEWVVTTHEGTIEGEETIQKTLSDQMDSLGAKAKRVSEELRQMPGPQTACGFVQERKGEQSIRDTACLGKYLNAMNVMHYLAFLEFLYDYEQVHRRIDDDGAAVYEPARFKFFA